MKKIILVTFALLLLAGCTSQQEYSEWKEVPEDAQRIFDKYNAVKADESFNKPFIIELSDESFEENFKDNFDYPDSLIRVITPETFKKLIQEQDELSQIFIFIGDKNNVSSYYVISRLYGAGKDYGIPTLYVDVNDIYENDEVNTWFRNQYFGTDNEEVIKQFFSEAGYPKDHDINTLPSPIILLWWNNSVIDYRTFTPNWVYTESVTNEFLVPIPQEGIDMYPLGCQEVKDISLFK